MQLSAEQATAVKHVGNRANWRNGHAWLAGYAGTGKTTIARHIEEAFGARRPLYVAPTNKAAKVLSEKIGRSATSIHKAIYYPPDEQPLGKLSWTINPEGAAAGADLIICDEASMVGRKLGADLMSFGRPVIAIGDPGQLPPVNDDPFFCVGRPDYLLSEIHRQARDNPIIALSQDVRLGRRLQHGRMGDVVWIARRGEVDIPDERPPQVIVGTHKRRWLITSAMRAMMGYDGWLPREGERLVCRKNSERHGELINGEEAVAVRFEEGADCLDVWTDLNPSPEPYKVWDGHFREHAERTRINPEYLTEDWIAQKQYDAFDFGWAITCHVSQGSQWDDVLVYDESRVFREDAARWLYTAVTRAAKRLTVIV